MVSTWVFYRAVIIHSSPRYTGSFILQIAILQIAWYCNIIRSVAWTVSNNSGELVCRLISAAENIFYSISVWLKSSNIFLRNMFWFANLLSECIGLRLGDYFWQPKFCSQFVTKPPTISEFRHICICIYIYIYIHIYIYICIYCIKEVDERAVGLLRLIQPFCLLPGSTRGHNKTVASPHRDV